MYRGDNLIYKNIENVENWCIFINILRRQLKLTEKIKEVKLWRNRQKRYVYAGKIFT